MGPATVGLAAVQLNIFVSTIFASHEPGAIAWLQYAFRILYLPIGMFGVAVGTVATTGLARRAAAGDTDGMRQTLRRALRLLAFLTHARHGRPDRAAHPIVRLLFERGRFDAQDTAAHRRRARPLLDRPGRLHEREGARARLLRAGPAAACPLLASALAVAHQPGRDPAAATGGWASAPSRWGPPLGSLVNGLVLIGVFERRVGGLVRGLLTGGIGQDCSPPVLMAQSAWLTARWLERSVGHGRPGRPARDRPGAGRGRGAWSYLVVTRLLRRARGRLDLGPPPAGSARDPSASVVQRLLATKSCGPTPPSC